MPPKTADTFPKKVAPKKAAPKKAAPKKAAPQKAELAANSKAIYNNFFAEVKAFTDFTNGKELENVVKTPKFLEHLKKLLDTFKILKDTNYYNRMIPIQASIYGNRVYVDFAQVDQFCGPDGLQDSPQKAELAANSKIDPYYVKPYFVNPEAIYNNFFVEVKAFTDFTNGKELENVVKTPKFLEHLKKLLDTFKILKDTNYYNRTIPIQASILGNRVYVDSARVDPDGLPRFCPSWYNLK